MTALSDDAPPEGSSLPWFTDAPGESKKVRRLSFFETLNYARFDSSPPDGALPRFTQSSGEPKRELTSTFSLACALKAFGAWFYRPSTLGLGIKAVNIIYLLVAVAGPMVAFVARQPYILLLCQNNSLLVLVEFLLPPFVFCTGIPASLGGAESNSWFTLFLASFSSLSLYYMATWITRVRFNSWHACIDVVAILIVLCIIGHGYRVVLTARKEMLEGRKKREERKGDVVGYERF